MGVDVKAPIQFAPSLVVGRRISVSRGAFGDRGPATVGSPGTSDGVDRHDILHDEFVMIDFGSEREAALFSRPKGGNHPSGGVSCGHGFVR